MGLKVTKLDKRHTGRAWFEYYVSPYVDPWQFPNNNLRQYRQLFQEWRLWCHETFGPGCERDWLVDIAQDFDPPVWAWCTDERIVGTTARLYLKSEVELVTFKLKWG